MAAKVKFGISKKLSLILLVVALVPLVTIWFFSYQTVMNLTTEKVNQELTSINDKLATYVDAWVDMNERMLLQNASLAAIRSMEEDQQTEVLKTIVEYFDWSYLTFTTDSEGNNVGRSDGKPPKFYGDRDYFKQVVEGKKFGRQVLIGKTSGKPAMVLSTGIYYGEKTLLGVLAQAMTLEDLSAAIVSSKIGETGFTFLVDEMGQVVAHPDAEMTQSRVDLSGHEALKALSNGQSTTVFVDSNGQKVVAVAKKTDKGFAMVSQQNYDEAYQFIKTENQKALVLLFSTLIVVLLATMFVSRWLTAPIRNLTEIADKYSQGQLDLEIQGLDRNDEIGLLSKAIDRMGTSIRLAMNRLKKMKAKSL